MIDKSIDANAPGESGHNDHQVEAKILIYDPKGDQVLLALGDIPTPLSLWFRTRWVPEDHRLLEAVFAATGLATALLEPLDFTTLVLEALTPSPPPAGYRWASRCEATFSEVSERWATGGLKRKQTWFEPGWYSNATSYLDGVSYRLEQVRVGALEPMKHWSMSSVLRAPTDRGLLYLKAILPELTYEPDVIKLLATVRPDGVPVIVADNAERHVWVAADFGGQSGTDLPPEALTGCLTLLVEFQHVATEWLTPLRDLGCLDLSLPTMRQRIPGLMARDDLWSATDQSRNQHRALSGQERTELLGLEPLLIAACDVLSREGIPDTLVHGDFHAGNVVRKNDSFLIHDWSFAAVGNPLFDLASWIYDAPDATAQTYIRSYFAEWRQRGVERNYERAWLTAKPLSAVAELMKFVWLADLVGPNYDFNWLSITYGWARRLLNAAADTDGAVAGWRK